MTRLSRRDDVNAAVANLMIKGAMRVYPREADYETFLFGDRGKPGATLHGDVNGGDPPRAPVGTDWLSFGRWLFCPLFCLYYHGPGPSTASLRWTVVYLPCRLPDCAYKRKAATTVARDRLHCIYNYSHAMKTKTTFFPFLVIHHSQK